MQSSQKLLAEVATLRKELNRLRAENGALKTERAAAPKGEYAFLWPSTSLSTGQFQDLDLSLLQRKYANLRSQLIVVGLQNGSRAFPPGKQRAGILASSCELQALNSQLGSDVESGPIACVSGEHLVQSLVAVAVRDWVFNTEFTSTATMETPLLNAYRHHLSSLCMFNCSYLARF